MSTDKLPEWPTYPSTAVTGPEWTTYQLQVRDAALARMEALVAFIEANRHAIRAPMTVGERKAMDALLAACERRREG